MATERQEANAAAIAAQIQERLDKEKAGGDADKLISADPRLAAIIYPDSTPNTATTPTPTKQ